MKTSKFAQAVVLSVKDSIRASVGIWKAMVELMVAAFVIPLALVPYVHPDILLAMTIGATILTVIRGCISVWTG